MNEKLILLKKDRSILKFIVKPAKKSKYGQVDIMIDGIKKKHFENVVAGNYYRHYSFPDSKINAISWHGYYEIRDDNNINMPKIHFKNESGSERIVSREPHIGTINAEEPFAVPICSLFVPANMNLEEIEKSEYPISLESRVHKVNLDSTKNKRIDIFVTPLGISGDFILRSSLKYVYDFADIKLFNTGIFEPLREIGESEDIDIQLIKLNNGHEIIIRTVGDQLNNSLEGTYSLLLHDPNDAYNRIANRFSLTYDPTISEESNLKNVKILKTVYENELKENEKG